MSDENDDALVRNYRLAVAWSRGGSAELEGVRFDFRSELDTAIWRPLSFTGPFVYGDQEFEPGVIYPWSPLAGLDLDDDAHEILEVEVGDLVRIGQIESQALPSRLGPLDAEENRVRKLVWLDVYRADGRIERSPRPLHLFAETGTALQVQLRDYTSAYPGLVAKLGEILGVEDLEDRLDEPRAEWLPDDLDLHPAYAEALDALELATNTVEDGAFVAFGYLMARAEAEARLLGPAHRGLQAVDSQALGARARRETSRARTEPLRVAARAVIAREPDISLTACARQVESVMAEDPAWTYKGDAKWMAKHLRELFEVRENGREYRPIRGV